MVRLFEKMFCHFIQLKCVVIFSVIVKVMRTDLSDCFGIYSSSGHNGRQWCTTVGSMHDGTCTKPRAV